ncbi:MAG TPA: hypothetical protein VIF62_16685 [Labilithrix sp.]
MTARLVVLLAAFVTAGCSKTAAPEPPPPEPKPSSATTSASSTASVASPTPASDASTAGPADVAYDAPAAWTNVPTNNPMRKATFAIPKVAGDSEDAEMTVSLAFGGVTPNVQRWSQQFQGATPKMERRHPNGLDVTVVELEGMYISGGPIMGGAGKPKDNWALLGAIVQGADNKLHFFKLVGPSKTVKAAKKDFDALVSSMRAK